MKHKTLPHVTNLQSPATELWERQRSLILTGLGGLFLLLIIAVPILVIRSTALQNQFIAIDGGTKTGAFQTVSDSLASGGDYTKFVSTPPPAPTPPPPTLPPSGQACPAFPSFPDANCTGVPASVVLSAYTGPTTITTAGTVIDGKNITTPIAVNANNVTIKNSRISSKPPDNKGVITVSSGRTGVLIQDCEVNGAGTGNNGHGIQGPATVRRCDVSNVENGFVPDTGSVLEDNYLHGMKGAKAFDGGVPHYDGVQIDGGLSSVIIRHNNIVNDYGQTAAIMMDTYFGSVTNVTVTQNRLVGGGITLYHIKQDTDGYTMSGNTVTNNYFRGWGYLAAEICVFDVASWSGNIDESNGTTIPKPAIRTQAQCV
jgi:hypothetical protein